jgi:ABC-type polysaccharide/polyol phosphate transport system ATPase subunit
VNASIDLRDVGVHFHFDRQRRVLSPTLAGLLRGGPSLWALRGLDLRVDAGEGVALVGPTGSGKSTLLRVLGAIIGADEGDVRVRGRIGTLLAAHSGLFGLLTGRENTEMIAGLRGASARDARAAAARVQELVMLGASFDLPVASYSQGMRARLGFAVATDGDVDVLLLDEVHDAIDHEFRAVVVERTEAIRESGGIVVAAGHDHAALEAMCDRAVQIGAGAVVADGEFGAVVESYRAEYPA